MKGDTSRASDSMHFDNVEHENFRHDEEQPGGVTMTTSVADPSMRTVTVWPWLARVTAICCLFGAQAIHTGVIGEHLLMWPPAGLFFLGISLVEGALAVALMMFPSRIVRHLVIWVSLGVVALWLFSRTVGLPFSPMAMEPFGREDVVCSLLELLTAAVLIVPAAATASPRRSLDYLRAAPIVLLVAAFTVFAWL